MEKGKFSHRYRERGSFKYIATWLMEKKGWTCQDVIRWLIFELKNCDKPASSVGKKFNPQPETASLLVYIGSVLREWFYNLARCIGKKYKLNEWCNCFHRVSTDVIKVDIHRFKDMVCFLRKYGCIRDEDFTDVEVELLKICRQFSKKIV